MASVAGVSIGVSAWPVLGSGTDGVNVIAGSGSASRISVAVPKSCYPSIYCGRGDRRTKKGKRFNHSFGNSRPKNKKKGKGIPPPPLPPRPPKKDFYDGEKIEVEIDDVLD